MNCEQPATHQITGGKPVCKEHGSQAKRDGKTVELRTGRKATCQYEGGN